MLQRHKSISELAIGVQVVEVGDAEGEEYEHGDGEGGDEERHGTLHHLLRPLHAQLRR